MSKQQGFEESASQLSFVPTAPPSNLPSAPPTYDEAMQQAGASYPVLPLPGSYAVPPQSTPVPQPLMPISNAVASQPFVQPAAPPTQTIVFSSLGRDRGYTVCPKCSAQVMTTTQENYKCSAFLSCCLLMFVCPCCCCIPFCMESCKIVKHKCPNCNTQLGTFRG